jgi:hypothetical protein
VKKAPTDSRLIVVFKCWLLTVLPGLRSPRPREATVEYSEEGFARRMARETVTATAGRCVGLYQVPHTKCPVLGGIMVHCCASQRARGNEGVS